MTGREEPMPGWINQFEARARLPGGSWADDMAVVYLYQGRIAVQTSGDEFRQTGCDVITYAWPAVVIQTLKPAWRPQLLLERDGALTAYTVRGRWRRQLIEQTGIAVVDHAAWGWSSPIPVPASVLGIHADHVPACVVSSG